MRDSDFAKRYTCFRSYPPGSKGDRTFRVQVFAWLAGTVLLWLGGSASAQAASQIPPSIAVVPSQWTVEPKRSLAEILGLDRDAIYLFRADQPGAKKVLPAGNTLFEWATLSPDLELIAYKFTYPDPAKKMPVDWR